MPASTPTESKAPFAPWRKMAPPQVLLPRTLRRAPVPVIAGDPGGDRVVDDPGAGQGDGLGVDGDAVRQLESRPIADDGAAHAVGGGADGHAGRVVVSCSTFVLARSPWKVTV